MSAPQTLEEICRSILGQAVRSLHTTFECLTPTQIIGATELLKAGAPLEPTANAMYILNRWGWFRLAGFDCEPWDITPEHVERLEQLAPWLHRRRGSGVGQTLAHKDPQMELFS